MEQWSQNEHEYEQKFYLPEVETDNYNQIPIELQSMKKWIVWRYESRDGKKTKVPYQPNGSKALSNSPNTWHSFESVVNAARLRKFDGIGFMFSNDDDLIGVDVDKCYKDGEFNEVAREAIENLDSYTEFSPSGNGIHIIIKGKLPSTITGTGKKSSKYGLEFYSHSRFFTFTGNKESENQIEERTEELEELILKYFPKDEPRQHIVATESHGTSLSENEIIDIALKSKTGTRFQLFLNGGWEQFYDNDYSRADLAFVNDLAFWTNCDYAMMDSIYRQSSLMRDKWNRKQNQSTYGDETLRKAISECSNTFIPKPKNDDFKLIVFDQGENSNYQTIKQIKSKLECNPNTGKIASNARNLELIFSSSLFKDSIGYDIFRQREVIFQDMHWRKRALPNKSYEQWLPSDDSQLMHWLNKHFDIKGKEVIINAFVNQTHQNHFHPVKDFIESANWDGVNRLDTFFIDFLGADNSEYVRSVTRKWFVAAVKRIYEPGCKFDYMPVLVGGQGVGKSSTIAKIAGDWFNDSLDSFESKEAGELLQGGWIFEIAELSAMKKSEEEEIKKFLSKQVDSYRPAYARVVVDNPRHCVFIGTTNTRDFLKDTTGNRRFLPITVSENRKHNPFEELTEELIHQLWAEALELYNLGENIDLEKELKQVAEKIQLEHTEQDPRTGKIADYLELLLPRNWDLMKPYERINWISGPEKGVVKREKVCAIEIWVECLGKSPDDLSTHEARKINGILRLIGWEQRNPSRTRFKHYGSQTTFIRKNVTDNT